MRENLIPNEICVGTAPSAQAAIDCIPGWTCQFPPSAGVEAGNAFHFEDARIHWAIRKLGVAGFTVLELGPLEGAHTWMLARAGAASVLAIEANRRNYLKCLITKEITDIRRTRFILGDFMPWLRENNTRFDVIIACAVLYHMTEPLELLRLIGKTADRGAFIWTHYFPDDADPAEPWMVRYAGAEVRDSVKHHIIRYDDTGQNTFCGGVYPHGMRIGRRDLFGFLRQLGFQHVDTTDDNRGHPNGPCIGIAAWK